MIKRKFIILSTVLFFILVLIVFLCIKKLNHIIPFDLDHELEYISPRERMELSSCVFLFYTGNYDICDKEGFGLINGNIIRIGYDKKDENVLFVAFTPFKQDKPSKQKFNISKIDLTNAKVTSVTDSNDEIFNTMQPVKSFMK